MRSYLIPLSLCLVLAPAVARGQGGAMMMTAEPEFDAALDVEAAASGADTLDRSALAAAAATRASQLGDCFSSATEQATALAMIAFDKKGKTAKVVVAGAGDAALERCLEKGLRPVKWPATKVGGAVVVRIRAVEAAADTGDMAPRRPGADLNEQLKAIKEADSQVKTGTAPGQGAK